MAEERRRKPEWTGLPAQRSSAVALNARLTLVSGLLILAVLSGVASTLAWVTSEAGAAPAAAPVRVEPRGRAAATIVAESYVSGSELYGVRVAAGAEFVSDGVSVLSGPEWLSWNPLSIGDGLFEQHVFDLYRQVGGEAVPYRLTVLIGVDQSGFARPALAAAPTLRRLPGAVAAPSSIPPVPTGSQAPTLPGSARERLVLWANAWASGDAEALKVFTGDPTPDVVYLGLGGYSVVDLDVVSATQVEERWLVRIRLLVEDPLLSGFSASGHRLVIDLDVTVEAAASGNPRVVGWGPAGSGLRLPGSVREPSAGR